MARAPARGLVPAVAEAAKRIRTEFGETATFSNEAMAALDAALFRLEREA